MFNANFGLHIIIQEKLSYVTGPKLHTLSGRGYVHEHAERVH